MPAGVYPLPDIGAGMTVSTYFLALQQFPAGYITDIGFLPQADDVNDLPSI